MHLSLEELEILRKLTYESLNSDPGFLRYWGSKFEILEFFQYRLDNFLMFYMVIFEIIFWPPSFKYCHPFKDVHRRQKLTTDFFFKLFELTVLVVTISISRKKNILTMVSGAHFLRGLTAKSKVLSISNSFWRQIFLQFEIHIGLHTRFRFTK